MEIIKANMDYIKEVVDMAYKSYKNQCKYTKEIEGSNKKDISKEMENALKNENGILCVENEKILGYLLYNDKWTSDETIYCMIPFWGYGAIGENKQKILSMLFQKLAEELCTDTKAHFEIKLYAYDEEIVRVFSFMEFGIQCEEGICSLDKEIPLNKASEIRELSKDQIKDHWLEIWSLLQSLIGHLRKSPVFYPGTEFTEEVYKDYLLDNDTRLFAAIMDKRIAGIITENKDGNSFINNKDNYYNVGDIYVLPEYRGRFIAQSMLRYSFEALAKKGINKFWVEHGTANPNARGFWNKYFKSYSYTMIRDIEKI